MHVFSLDVTSGARTPIVDEPLIPDGTSFYGRVPLANWSPDRQHALLIDPDGLVRGIVDVANHRLTGPGALSAIRFANSDAQLTWSPGSDRVAALVYDDQTDSSQHLLIVDLSGREIASLALPDDSSAGYPSWSPDGSSILLAGCIACDPDPTAKKVPNSTPPPGRLFVVPTDGTAARTLPMNADINAGTAVWSPDASTIAYRTPTGIAVTTMADAHETIVTHGIDLELAWSPDGHRIAFARLDDEGVNNGIYTVSIDGTHLTRLTDGDDHLPDWSPDGSTLVFSRPDNHACCPSTWVVSSGGGEPRVLIKNASSDW
jgi:TolB protein